MVKDLRNKLLAMSEEERQHNITLLKSMNIPIPDLTPKRPVKLQATTKLAAYIEEIQMTCRCCKTTVPTSYMMTPNEVRGGDALRSKLKSCHGGISHLPFKVAKRSRPVCNSCLEVLSTRTAGSLAEEVIMLRQENNL